MPVSSFSSSCWFLRPKNNICIFHFLVWCVQHQQVAFFRTYEVFFLQLFFFVFLHNVLQNSCRLFRFVLFLCLRYFRLFNVFITFPFNDLACFVVFSYPVDKLFSLAHLDVLRPFGLLCFTGCDHIICMSQE